MSTHRNPRSCRLFAPERKAFLSGQADHAWRFFGAHPARSPEGGEGYRFRVWAPRAKAVTLIGDFNDWDPQATPMGKLRGGIWECFVPGVQRYDSYQFAVYSADGRFCPKADPFAFHAATRPDTASKVYDLSGGHTWGDEHWLAYRAKQDFDTAPMNIYECHLGSWRRTGDGGFLGYREIASYLIPWAKEMGYTHVEFLPVTEHPLDASWGYQCTGYFAPTSRFGTPDDLKYLIDRLHQAGLGVILDWVPSHFPRDRFGLYHFDGAPTFESPDPAVAENTPWGTNRFDLSKKAVCSFLLSSAMFWLEEYHADGLRVDSVTSLLYPDFYREEVRTPRQDAHAVAFLRQLNTAVRTAHPDVLMIAEDSSPFPKVTAPVSEGGLGFHFKWNLGWTHDTCRYMAKEPSLRPEDATDMTFPLVYAFSERYILPLSHDEFTWEKGSLFQHMPGRPADKFCNVRAFYTCMMTHPGKKLTFMGTDFGQQQEWRSPYSLDWHLLNYEPHRQIKTFFRTINQLYLGQPALWDDTPEGFQWLSADEKKTGVFSYLRRDRQGDALVVVCNFSDRHLTGHRVGVPAPGRWTPILNTDDTAFGGQGRGDAAAGTAAAVPCDGQAHSLVIDLPPLTALIFASPHSHRE